MVICKTHSITNETTDIEENKLLEKTKCYYTDIPVWITYLL